MWDWLENPHAIATMAMLASEVSLLLAHSTLVMTRYCIGVIPVAARNFRAK